MPCYFKDISLETTYCISDRESSLNSYFGSAICINVSHIHHTDIIDIKKIKKALSQCKEKLMPGDIVLLYTGRSDRFYNTSKWLDSRAVMTIETAKYLEAKGAKHIAIDSPFIVNSLDYNFLNIPITLSLYNIGHLVNKRFIFAGFPLLSFNSQRQFLRAVAFY